MSEELGEKKSLPTVSDQKASFTVEQWETLPANERSRLVSESSGGELRRQTGDSIEWALWSWNPVSGCHHPCGYCYARTIAERFRGSPGYPNGFEPTFFPNRLGAPAAKRPPKADTIADRNIFTCSMADLFGKWVPGDWIQAVLDRAERNPQWRFLFLAKFPKRLTEFRFPSNAWVGASIDSQARVTSTEAAMVAVDAKVKWLSVEPMLEPIRLNRPELFDWVVIGGQTGPKFHPPENWIQDLESQCANIPVFEKTNLRPEGSERRREFPPA
jgi:protein gp37